jgi:glutathione S-transferase
MLTLYYAPATCALASHIALEQAGADYCTERVDFKSSQQRSPEYLKLNPKGRVPALVTERGVLTETPAILLYIAQCFPQAKLAPFDDPWALAQLNAFCSYLCSTVHVAHAHKRRGARWADDPTAIEAMQRKVAANMTACFDHIEADVLQGPWAFGQDYTIADPYLFTIGEWLEGDGVDVSRYPKLLAHRARMLARESVQRAKAAVQR